MSLRTYVLPDGTVKTVASGRFTGDDDVVTRTITEKIIVHDRDVEHSAPVVINPDDPRGPLLIRFDSDEQKA